MIIKRVDTPYGIPADIWKLGYVNIDRVGKCGSITMNLYFTETTDKYIDSKTLLVRRDEFDQYFESGGDLFENCERFMLENCEVFKTSDARYFSLY